MNITADLIQILYIFSIPCILVYQYSKKMHMIYEIHILLNFSYIFLYNKTK